jgi:DNA-binding NtrC family response regulator
MRVLWTGSAHGSARQALARLESPQVLPGAPEAVAWLEGSRVDAVVVGCPVESCDAADALDAIRHATDAPVIVIDPWATVESAARLSRAGAWQVFGAAAAAEQLMDEIAAAAEDHRLREGAAAPSSEPWRRLLVGSSRGIVLLCHKRREQQNGQQGNRFSKALWILVRSVAMELGLCRSARVRRASGLEFGRNPRGA